MQIYLNNKTENVDDGACLSEIVIARLGDKLKGVAVALNNNVVPRQSWQQTKLNPSDNILIIKATQGG